MKVLDPGHTYLLDQLDHPNDAGQLLTFVKRDQPTGRYPGNSGHHPGVICQEVLRALIDRTAYVNGQVPCLETEMAEEFLIRALAMFERRAARVHGLTLQATEAEIAQMAVCTHCGHVVCSTHSAGLGDGGIG